MARRVWGLHAVIDAQGYRANVAIVLGDGRGRVLWAKRVGHDSWQFPQGGIQAGETPEEALYRELWEEVGLEAADVRVLARTEGWLRYRIPSRYLRRRGKPRCIGQKQKWFLLELIGPEEKIRFDRGEKPEFEAWRWVPYWYPVDQIVDFKRAVYRQALRALLPAHLEVERRFERQRVQEDA